MDPHAEALELALSYGLSVKLSLVDIEAAKQTAAYRRVRALIDNADDADAFHAILSGQYGGAI